MDIIVYFECGHHYTLEPGDWIPEVNDDYYCKTCEEDTITTNIITDPPPSTWVNVYYITRHYGGPEEGGWWYDRHECVESIECKSEDEAEIKKQALKKEHQDENFGNIYSVLGGQVVQVAIEPYQAHTETVGRPQYE